MRAALDLAKLASKAGDAAKLQAKVEAEPANHQARIDYAMALAAGGKKAEATDQLLESFRRDRKWNEEAARKQLVQLFDAWGPKDPATLEGRRSCRRSCSRKIPSGSRVAEALPSAIAGPADLPQRIPVFPLRGAILLPRATLPLNVFEPRYLAMLDDVDVDSARARHGAAGRRRGGIAGRPHGAAAAHRLRRPRHQPIRSSMTAAC